MNDIIKCITQCLLAIVIMIFINDLSPLIGLIPGIGMGDLGYILFHLLIVLMTFIVFTIWIKKIIKSNLNDYRITKPYLSLKWAVLGLSGIGYIYMLFMIFTQGSWQLNHHIWSVIVVILITSLTTAVSEELFFRGFLMGFIEKSVNTFCGLLISALIFSLLHLMNGNYDLTNSIIIIVGLFIAGIFYGLVTIYYQTIWSAITIHFLFDATQLFNITTERDYQSVMEYVYHNSSLLITGGQYGATISIITISAFLLMTLYLLMRLKRKTHKRID
ncbi:CAAX amino terminal protease self-immunity [Mycobacteroides abscessus subsp. massiliense]|nr:CAAX amino terminal protease self-immunity [Mycobacteroides abscessus subsp. massiliense]